jgi:hypothetical protein
MEILGHALLFLHFLGLAGIIGGFLVQLLAPAAAERGIKAMLHGGYTQLVTGLALVGLYEGPLDKTVDHAKIGTKLVVALAVVVCVFIAKRRAAGQAGGLVRAAGLLAVANVAVAVFWTTS